MKTNRLLCSSYADAGQAFVIAAVLVLSLTDSVASQTKRRPGEPKWQSFEFETVTVNAEGKITNRRKGEARSYVEDINGVGLEMVEVPGGSFTMGLSGSREADPAHPVSVPTFYMGKYEVTQAQWEAVAKLPKVSLELNPYPSAIAGDNLPVEQITWDEAMEFCARLSRATGRIYGLPSEAEWEYACRAGTTTAYAFGETITAEIVNYDSSMSSGSASKGIPRNRTTRVGFFGVANGYGLYDMHGNVEEWCLDCYHQTYAGAPADGNAWEDNCYITLLMRRGGSWRRNESACASAWREELGSSTRWGTLGFRVAAPAATRTVAVADYVSSKGEATSSSSSARAQADDELQHDWHRGQGKNGVNYISHHPTRFPYSYSKEPEAIIAVESANLSSKTPSLNKVMASEIKGIRKKLQLAPYLEEDGHQPQADIASWIEEIEGQQVAFIKYRTVGAIGEPGAMPRSVRRAILIKNDKLYFVQLSVLFAKHQQEVRDDQIRLVKGIIRKYTRNE